ncbi:hypothetical protein BV210_02635 [Halorientalis sp. IM1011]|uniref:DUF7289 family protein n=1 Tax=Halorientalis sp. IM1011 TaxID=1932360 RepID=UPI00097CD0A6|nr:hypothetical protein [Halorientalis sp. IM1011]AQL41676.1 hypothetical protein BV210_02635 [Halorientalis sp. IM1011]
MAAGTARSGTRAQSGPVGYVLVFAIVMAGMAIIVLIGAGGLSSTQSQSELQRAEHSMTLFDSRAAMVALGDSGGQSISFGQDSGSFRVEDENGWMRLTHDNYTEDDDAEREVIYNKSMGALIYENGDRTMAYQGGGVWQRDSNGEARMVSPPEFHYRGATLTLPVIRTLGGGNAKGSVDVSIRPQKQAKLIFPNTTAPDDGSPEVGAPYNDTERDYTNPIRNGTVNVTVRSDYYEAWAKYFRERTTGEVTVWDENRTVRLNLLSIGGPPGSFTIPEEGESVPAGGIADGHPLKEFEFDIVYTKGNNDHFSLYDEKNNQEYELHVVPTGSNYHNDCPDEDQLDSPVYVSLYYYSGDGSGKYEFWETRIDPDNHPDSKIEWTCASEGPKLSIDLLSDFGGMDYDQSAPGVSSSKNGNKWRFGEHIKKTYEHGDATLHQHDSISWEDPASTYSPTIDDTDRTLDEIVNHYTALMGPDIDMTSQMGPGNSRAIVQDASSGTLTYETAEGAEYITYLHVTENEIEVDFD